VRQTARDVLLLSQLELTEMLDVAPAAASALLLAVSRSVVGEPNTVGCPAPPEAEVGLLALGASHPCTLRCLTVQQPLHLQPQAYGM